MYPTLTDRSMQSMRARIEAELELLYCPDFHFANGRIRVGQLITSPLSYLAGQTDCLRQFIAEDTCGFYFDLRFSRDEYRFMSAFSQWLASLSECDVGEFPDLTELVIRRFREGDAMESLPVFELKGYAARWGCNVWATIQHYKALNRHLHEHFQWALTAWHNNLNK